MTIYLGSFKKPYPAYFYSFYL